VAASSPRVNCAMTRPRSSGGTSSPFAADRSRVRVAKEVLALVAFTTDNHDESWLAFGLSETGCVPVWDLFFPFSMAMALMSGIPISMVQSPG